METLFQIFLARTICGARELVEREFMKDILVIVATELEARKLPKLPGMRTRVSNIGAVNAALETQLGILEQRPDLVLSVGIGGAYPNSGAKIGDVVVASEMIYAALGAMDGNTFLNLEELGFPILGNTFNTIQAAPQSRDFAALTKAKLGAILTLETVTGSDARALELETLFPNAIGEGMEGAGVAHAALKHGIPGLEIRGISNFVGARDRSSWQIGAALKALHQSLELGWRAFE
jgi:futalosine hydrolase